MINCAIYPRKSKADDNSDSMETQIAMCTDYLNQHYGENNYTVSIYDGDYGISGHSTKNRKDFQRMMDDVKAGLIQLVVIQRYDRIARNTRDFCNIFHEMEVNNCDLVSVSQQIDTTTPYGKNFMYMQASMAELEWALNSERRKDVNRHAATIGKCTLAPHLIPIGYTTQIIDGVRRMVKDKATEPIAIEIFRYFSQYYNYTATARHINAMFPNSRVWTNQMIKKVIRNRLYTGEYRGNKAFCEPYLTVEEWEEIQRKKPPIRNELKHKKESWFIGLAECPICGRNLRAQTRSKPNRPTYKYLVCQYAQQGLCTNRKVKSELIVEGQLVDFINRYVNDVSISVKGKQTAKPDNSKQKISMLEKELERINVMFQKGRIDLEKYDTEYLRIENEIARIRQSATPQGHVEKIKDTFSGEWETLYHQLDDLHKKLFWRKIVRRLHFTQDMDLQDVSFR